MTRSLEELREYLVGEWKFDNDFLDSSGNGNHGTPTDIEWKPTARGLKPYNTTYNGYVSCGTDSTLDVSGNIQFSISFWCYIANKNEHQVFCAAGDALSSNGDKGFAISYMNNGNIFFDVYDDSTRSAVAGNINKGLNHIVVTWDGNGSGRIYINGLLLYSNDSMVSFINTQFDFRIFSDISNPPWNVPKWMDDVRFYKNVIFAPDEVLALYESTKNAVGVRPAERSFTHRLKPDVDDNTVFATDMSTKNADGTLMDLSGNPNHGTIDGAVRSGGYFSDGMRFDEDYIRLPIDEIMGTYNNFVLESFFYMNVIDNYRQAIIDNVYIRASQTDGFGLGQRQNFEFGDGTSNYTVDAESQFIEYEYNHSIVVFDNGTVTFYLNGNIISTHDTPATEIQIDTQVAYIGRRYGGDYYYFDGKMNLLSIKTDNVPSESQIKSRFNSLATLPLYTFDASKYPTSSGWTSNVPYSSMIISSGEFSFTDAGQLQCDSVGSFTLRNAHQFDGDEYIKVVIDGVEYTGTGSVSQGNVTVAITQSSTKIDVDMGTSDLIDGIDIQFREPVE
jgi:hypothetical protein